MEQSNEVIPVEFSMGPRSWQVKWVCAKEMKRQSRRDAWGCCDPVKAIIYLNKALLNESHELILHTWEHELLHALKFTYGETDHDEVEVDGKAGLRAQYELSKKMAPEGAE